MPIIAAAGKHRRKVRFPTNPSTTTTTAQAPHRNKSTTKKSQRESSTNTVSPTRATTSATKNDNWVSNKMASDTQQPRAGIPRLFSEPHPIQDPLLTDTAQLQNEVVESCLPFLRGVEGSQKGPFNEHGVPALQRDDHIQYLCDALEDYPAGFVVLDASRPWMVLWALSGLVLLGQDISRYRER